MNKATIFNLQKFSIHDGPGIRTTVFMKGCPLHCPWCSNPESQNRHIEILWDGEKCTGCGKCRSNEKIKFVQAKGSFERKYHNKYNEFMLPVNLEYEEAEKLVKICPSDAIGYEGREMSIDEIVSEVEKDRPFYDESGGGVTLSGGEVLFQMDSAMEILKKCRENKIHTAVETTCLADSRRFKKFIENVDLLLCDIKHYDSEYAKKIIGTELDDIFRNIKYAVSLESVEVIGRIPVIPGFNYSLEDAHGLALKIKELGIKKVNLLPYHCFGEKKYRLLNREYMYSGVEPLYKDNCDFIEYMNVFKKEGLQVS